MIVITLLVNIEAIDHFWVRAMVDNSENLIQEVKVKNLNIINSHLTTKDFRDVHIMAVEISTVIAINSSSKTINKPHLEEVEEEFMGILHIRQEDVPIVDLIITLTIIISINITHTSNRLNNMVHLAVYAVDLIIPLNTATKVNMT